ncbi:hypothetical protein CNMCM8689_005778 [Aspergillus fumigatus]|nr:hypothetical protein CNMCM8057_005695 [Aspergillus fumigatus]KAF4288387.1 hypothetical protein CNMCM8689_005778 [Aspergillus fumigatus]
MASLNQDQIKILEQSRQRLVQLTRSLASLIGSLNQSDPLPSWSSLQSQAGIISNNLVSISEHLADNKDLLSALVAYPGPSYPGRTQAPTLEQLLRTKLDPRVEDWVSRGRRAGASALEDRGGEEEEMEVVGVRRRSGAGAGLEFDIAAPAPGSRQQQQQKAAGPAVPLEDILRYMTTGIPPTQR